MSYGFYQKKNNNKFVEVLKGLGIILGNIFGGLVLISAVLSGLGSVGHYSSVSNTRTTNTKAERREDVTANSKFYNMTKEQKWDRLLEEYKILPSYELIEPLPKINRARFDLLSLIEQDNDPILIAKMAEIKEPFMFEYSEYKIARVLPFEYKILTQKRVLELDDIHKMPLDNFVWPEYKNALLWGRSQNPANYGTRLGNKKKRDLIYPLKTTILVPQLNVTKQREFVNDEFDYLTSEYDKLLTLFTASGHVSGSKNDQPIFDIDQTNYSAINGILFFTHWDTDHVKANSLERIIDEGNYEFIIAPNLFQSTTSNKAFEVLTGHSADFVENSIENGLIIRTPDSINAKPPEIYATLDVGDFYCYRLKIKGDISVDIYKYKNPSSPNTEGLIYHIIHKGIGYMFFGDFDYLDGINSLLEMSAKNEAEYNEVNINIGNLELQMSEITEKMIQLAENINDTSTNEETMNELVATNLIEEESMNELVIIDFIEEEENINELATTNLIKEYEELGDQLIILSKQIAELRDKLLNLPTIKSKIVKWPHHAYDFKMDDRIKDTLKNAETIISPDFYIYENYPTQKTLKCY